MHYHAEVLLRENANKFEERVDAIMAPFNEEVSGADGWYDWYVIGGRWIGAHLKSYDPDKDIYLYVNSPGGIVTSGLAIYDTMNYIKCPVSTICIGQAASMGAVLLAAGTKGKRYALPNARIMIHQPWGGVQGQATDISIQAKEILRLKDRLNEILAKHTGKKVEEISNSTDRDNFMSADEAQHYGLIDEVLRRADDVPGGPTAVKTKDPKDK